MLFTKSTSVASFLIIRKASKEVSMFQLIFLDLKGKLTYFDTVVFFSLLSGLTSWNC